MENITAIIVPVICVAILIIATLWAKWSHAKNLLKEIAEALTILSQALADDKLTDDERKAIVLAWKDVIVSARELLRK